MIEIGGSVEPGFEGVAEAFRANFAEHGEIGASAAVYLGGRKVVDLWGGLSDKATGAVYGEDTLQLVFSSTKGATAACANLLAQRGELDVDAPVATYWPEFKAAGKENIPVRWLLCHKAGLPYVDATLTLEDALAWDPMVRALEAQAPIWEPGTAHGYHATTYGWLVGEVVRRITGKSLGRFFADEIAGPLGLEFWIGLPDDEQERVSPLQTLGRPKDPAVEQLMEQFMGPDTLLGKALGAPSGVFTGEGGVFNRPEVRAAEVPAANGVTNARSMARLYAGLVGVVDGGPGTPLLTEDQIARASETQTSGPDQILYLETTFGLGFMTSSTFAPFGGPRSFGHTGAGGSVGFADPEHGIGFGYAMNRMMQNLSGDPRTRGLVQAVYDAVGVVPTFV
ncbi:MAG: serine hydrolase domain-containing protein [Acidimicrobiales bacterium]|nr:serine hydrolase domain-containing protein [Acidimicrobiales bacterium]